jgi:hypothetical protein
VRLVGEAGALFIAVVTPKEKTARRTFRASGRQPSASGLFLASWVPPAGSIVMTNVTVAASTCGQWLNARLGRPLYHRMNSVLLN